MENDIVWSEIGSGLGEVGGTSPPGIPRRTPPPPGFRDASLTQSHNELMKALKLALKVIKEVMTLLFKIINLMANLNILSDPLLALRMLYEGKGGGGGGGVRGKL